MRGYRKSGLKSSVEVVWFSSKNCFVSEHLTAAKLDNNVRVSFVIQEGPANEVLLLGDATRYRKLDNIVRGLDEL